MTKPAVCASRFTGKERDTESGLDYFGARYYASTTGRVTSPDDGRDRNPSDPQTFNLYSYVRNNPLINSDPDGHTCQINSSDGANYDDGDGKGCSVVDAEEVLAPVIYQVTTSNSDVSQELATDISNLTSRDSLLNAAANGFADAQIVEGFAILPNLFGMLVT